MKCTCPTPAPLQKAQRHLYSTDWCRGLASGVRQILSLASGVTQILALGNAKTYQHVGISNAKFWRRGHCPTPTPDARYFASQWNIGFRLCRKLNLRNAQVALLIYTGVNGHTYQRSLYLEIIMVYLILIYLNHSIFLYIIKQILGCLTLYGTI